MREKHAIHALSLGAFDSTVSTVDYSPTGPCTFASSTKKCVEGAKERQKGGGNSTYRLKHRANSCMHVNSKSTIVCHLRRCCKQLRRVPALYDSLEGTVGAERYSQIPRDAPAVLDAMNAFMTATQSASFGYGEASRTKLHQHRRMCMWSGRRRALLACILLYFMAGIEP